MSERQGPVVPVCRFFCRRTSVDSSPSAPVLLRPHTRGWCCTFSCSSLCKELCLHPQPFTAVIMYDSSLRIVQLLLPRSSFAALGYYSVILLLNFPKLCECLSPASKVLSHDTHCKGRKTLNLLTMRILLSLRLIAQCLWPCLAKMRRLVKIWEMIIMWLPRLVHWDFP